ncbi:hypothetical protein NMG60_11007165 [Bertholletia excelsa]
MEKSKSLGGYPCSYSEVRLGFEDRAKSYSFNGPDDNPEVKRRKRVASYNMYTMEAYAYRGYLNQEFDHLCLQINPSITEGLQ